MSSTKHYFLEAVDSNNKKKYNAATNIAASSEPQPQPLIQVQSINAKAVDVFNNLDVYNLSEFVQVCLVSFIKKILDNNVRLCGLIFRMVHQKQKDMCDEYLALQAKRYELNENEIRYVTERVLNFSTSEVTNQIVALQTARTHGPAINKPNGLYNDIAKDLMLTRKKIIEGSTEQIGLYYHRTRAKNKGPIKA